VSTFFGINIALSSLLAQQRALDVVGNNVANVNTPGYRRQEAVLRAGEPYPAPGASALLMGGQYGSGVEVEMIRRAQNAYLDLQARTAKQEAARWESAHACLQEVQTIITQTSDSDLGALLDRFWNAWQDLSANPEELAARVNVRQQGITLTEAIRTTVADLRQSQAGIDLQLKGKVDEVNRLAAEVASLNQQIAAAQADGKQPNDLLDRRDQALSQLSELIGITAYATDRGDIIANVGARPLVQGGESYAIEAATRADGHIELRWQEDGAAVALQSGEMLGMIGVRDESIPNYLAQLDALATNLISAVNALHQTGYGLDGSSGNDFFTGTGAADIDVSAAVQAEARVVVAAAAADSPGDGSLALQIAQMRDQGLVGGLTLNDAFRSLATEVAAAARSAADTLAAKQLSLEQVTQNQQSLYGVSLDEEMTNMIMYQHAYEAAARLMATLDEMLSTLIEKTAA
jgi:flagellar hook-associated protein 1 FlgK